MLLGCSIFDRLTYCDRCIPPLQLISQPALLHFIFNQTVYTKNPQYPNPNNVKSSREVRKPQNNFYTLLISPTLGIFSRFHCFHIPFFSTFLFSFRGRFQSIYMKEQEIKRQKLNQNERDNLARI